MLLFEYNQLFMVRKWRWVTIHIILLTFSFIVTVIQHDSNYWDFLFGTLLQFFFMFVLITSTFSFFNQ